MKLKLLLTALLATAALPGGSASAAGERVSVTGEIMDTWCYLSGVMGGQDGTVGSAHHTCALWCAAGGIPVGLLAEDGTLYMVLKLNGASTTDGNPGILTIQSHKVAAEGQVYRRDGFNYLVVEKVVADAGITVKNHDDFGFVPSQAVPDDEIERIKKQ